MSGGAGGTLRELATGKSVAASTTQAGYPPEQGNDGDPATRWAASSTALPQWWRVDLGAPHLLNQVLVQFEHPDRTYSYFIETSQDDSVYVLGPSVNGTGAAQVVDLPKNVSARYVRVTVTDVSPVPNGAPWASFWEFSVLGI